jgi:6-phosphogluconate dehydrogenase (decarboxylating)
MAQSTFGIVGLGVMGRNLALNVADRGFQVAGFDLDRLKGAALVKSGAGKVQAAGALSELSALLDRPRRILIMVPAGPPVDSAIADLRPHLESGDILIDGGNSFFRDTDRRAGELTKSGIQFIGMGVSGGEEGARHGPALMPGGPEDAYRQVEPILDSIAAKVDGKADQEWPHKRADGGHHVQRIQSGAGALLVGLGDDGIRYRAARAHEQPDKGDGDAGPRQRAAARRGPECNSRQQRPADEEGLPEWPVGEPGDDEHGDQGAPGKEREEDAGFV